MVSGEGAPRVGAGEWVGRKQPQTGNLSLTVSLVFLASLLGLDQGGDTCVHEIPFCFDLMGLLPQCQQLQMFFLLLSRGG